jgi:hypothetical protein
MKSEDAESSNPKPSLRDDLDALHKIITPATKQAINEHLAARVAYSPTTCDDQTLWCHAVVPPYWNTALQCVSETCNRPMPCIMHTAIWPPQTKLKEGYCRRCSSGDHSLHDHKGCRACRCIESPPSPYVDHETGSTWPANLSHSSTYQPIMSLDEIAAAERPDPLMQANAESLTEWRVGKQVELNVYEGDRPVCQCHTPRDAKRIVEAVNKNRLRPIGTLAKRESARSAALPT